jgi:hypothetical protein
MVGVGVQRLQESMQDIHLDMIRSFHMLQVRPVSAGLLIAALGGIAVMCSADFAASAPLNCVPLGEPCR